MVYKLKYWGNTMTKHYAKNNYFLWPDHTNSSTAPGQVNN